MADVDINNLPLYMPFGAVAKRLYAYLENVEKEHYGSYVSGPQLYAVAQKAGIKRNEVYAGLKELERVVNCAFFWNSDERCVYYRVCNISAEEKIMMIQHHVWFESLGDNW